METLDPATSPDIMFILRVTPAGLKFCPLEGRTDTTTTEISFQLPPRFAETHRSLATQMCEGSSVDAGSRRGTSAHQDPCPLSIQ